MYEMYGAARPTGLARVAVALVPSPATAAAPIVYLRCPRTDAAIVISPSSAEDERRPRTRTRARRPYDVSPLWVYPHLRPRARPSLVPSADAALIARAFESIGAVVAHAGCRARRAGIGAAGSRDLAYPPAARFAHEHSLGACGSTPAWRAALA